VGQEKARRCSKSAKKIRRSARKRDVAPVASDFGARHFRSSLYLSLLKRKESILKREERESFGLSGQRLGARLPDDGRLFCRAGWQAQPRTGGQARPCNGSAEIAGRDVCANFIDHFITGRWLHETARAGRPVGSPGISIGSATTQALGAGRGTNAAWLVRQLNQGSQQLLAEKIPSMLPGDDSSPVAEERKLRKRARPAMAPPGGGIASAG